MAHRNSRGKLFVLRESGTVVCLLNKCCFCPSASLPRRRRRCCTQKWSGIGGGVLVLLTSLTASRSAAHAVVNHKGRCTRRPGTEGARHEGHTVPSSSDHRTTACACASLSARAHVPVCARAAVRVAHRRLCGRACARACACPEGGGPRPRAGGGARGGAPRGGRPHLHKAAQPQRLLPLVVSHVGKELDGVGLDGVRQHGPIAAPPAGHARPKEVQQLVVAPEFPAVGAGTWGGGGEGHCGAVGASLRALLGRSTKHFGG